MSLIVMTTMVLMIMRMVMMYSGKQQNWPTLAW